MFMKQKLITHKILVAELKHVVQTARAYLVHRVFADEIILVRVAEIIKHLRRILHGFLIFRRFAVEYPHWILLKP